MSKAHVSKNPSNTSDIGPDLISEVLAAIAEGKAVRRDLENGGRLHIDRPLPFLCIHASIRLDSAARDVASANASYLICPDVVASVPIVEAVAGAMAARFGAFILIDVGELERDRLLTEDAPYLPPFELTVSTTNEPATKAAASAFTTAVEGAEAKYRSPRITRVRSADDPCAQLAALSNIPCITVRFAPIYRVPKSESIYPELRQRLVANILDAALQAIAAFTKASGSLVLSTHRALGRQAFVDAVRRADRNIDEIAATFDFLLAVTPINSDAAWFEFEAGGFERAPKFLYRPLTVEVDAEKRKLFSVAFDGFEDPVLLDLYREKQQELDLQLSMLTARETPRFVELGRALYGSVEPVLLGMARNILTTTGASEEADDREESADCYCLERKAIAMIDSYHRRYAGFEATVQLRDDLPAGLMVSGACLFISRSTKMSPRRVEALLSHEIGVHLLTYFNGSAQGLHVFRSGLAGYEGIQEGLAVFAEYLVGGMTSTRLRLIAARVVACAAMLEGASFQETFLSLVREQGFAQKSAFNLTLRLYRGGGLAKDAIYLRGLLELLSHLRNGGALDPFWMGKVSASHFGIMQELNLRGLLKEPQLRPAFLNHPQAEARLARARSGLSAVEMIGS